MIKFILYNFMDKTINIGIEPWVGLVELGPNGEAVIEYDDKTNFHMGVNDLGVVLGVGMSDQIKITANGREETFGP